MRLTVSFCPVVLALVLVAPCSSVAQDPEWVLDGVIVAENRAFSVALVRRAGAKRARTLRIGQQYAGYVLVDVTKTSVLLTGSDGDVRLFMGGPREKMAAPLPANEVPRAEKNEWVQRDFSRSQASARLEKEIPVILSDTELTPRVEEGEVRGLELLRLPDGTLLSETGLLPGDVLRSINGERLRGLDSLWEILARYQDAEELRVVVERRGEVLRLAYAFTN